MWCLPLSSPCQPPLPDYHTHRNTARAELMHIRGVGSSWWLACHRWYIWSCHSVQLHCIGTDTVLSISGPSSGLITPLAMWISSAGWGSSMAMSRLYWTCLALVSWGLRSLLVWVVDSGLPGCAETEIGLVGEQFKSFRGSIGGGLFWANLRIFWYSLWI